MSSTLHPLKLVSFIDAAFEAQPGGPTALALRGLAATLMEDRRDNNQPTSRSGKLT